MVSKSPQWRKLALAAIVAPALLGALGTVAQAKELIYGSWPPAGNYMNSDALPWVFKNIEKDTNGAIKWRLIPGGQIANGKATFTAVRDGLMQGGMGVATYVPNIVPSVTAIYSTLLFGDDVVAASAAGNETIALHCPSCLEEYRKMNAVAFAGWVAAPYQLMCREPVKTVDDLKGKRIRATGGNAEMLKMAGAVPVAGTLTEAVNLLQRGGIDCVLGATDWLRTIIRSACRGRPSACCSTARPGTDSPPRRRKSTSNMRRISSPTWLFRISSFGTRSR